MAHVIALSNHKGGVGKTTTTANVGAALAALGKSVLLVDLDPQANLSQSLGHPNAQQTIYGALQGLYALPVLPIVQGLALCPSTLDLSGAEIELASEPGREYLLAQLLEPLRPGFDFILIDCPPSLGLLTVNALAAADGLYIPLQPQYLATQGLAKLTQITQKVAQRLNKGLALEGIIITQYDSRKILNRDVVASLEEHFPGLVFTTKIRDNVALAEAPAQGLDIFRYSPRSYGAQDYLELSKEILSKHRKPSNPRKLDTL